MDHIRIMGDDFLFFCESTPCLGKYPRLLRRPHIRPSDISRPQTLNDEAILIAAKQHAHAEEHDDVPALSRAGLQEEEV